MGMKGGGRLSAWVISGLKRYILTISFLLKNVVIKTPLNLSACLINNKNIPFACSAVFAQAI
ncbi:hypothetical protein ESA_03486 [Cronobacter sakazakii ATCC BAA-894]|uniref:Uncharacterized protein n=1 Tax=Cronobacter sakazakii (strain ATCC BAA-894) TaxID=290339 RepID=A7MIT9_CROS8|nr:hypothetical protein ESA_03486 [Cronobacter sakazakii ATCC BAA-894]